MAKPNPGFKGLNDDSDQSDAEFQPLYDDPDELEYETSFIILNSA